MAGVADKARFYLERSVPQLREWEEKEIFSKEEIRTIVQKRNDYEHKVLSPGNTPGEWSSFAKWEQSLETLRAKRCKRMKIQHLNSAHAGQGRVMSIYDRAVNRHPGSSDLWREYLGYAASVKASKRWRKTMTQALRMMPTDANLWVLAGRRSARNGDMASARGFFMRGCRFCSKDCRLWVEYAKCEMEWLAKVDKRKAKAKPGASASDTLRPDRTDDDDKLRIDISSDEDEDDEGNTLPQPSKAQADVIDKKESQQLKSNPAMDGAIPMAVFDISRKQSFFTPEAAETFFFMFAAFRGVSVQPRILQHVSEVLNEQFPNHPSTCNCYIQEPIFGLQGNTPEFVRGLREALTRLGDALEKTPDKSELSRKSAAWIDGYLNLSQLDESLVAVLEQTKLKLEV